jgi:hypothetical protein
MNGRFALLGFVVGESRIVEIDVIADPDRVRASPVTFSETRTGPDRPEGVRVVPIRTRLRDGETMADVQAIADRLQVESPRGEFTAYVPSTW